MIRTLTDEKIIPSSAIASLTQHIAQDKKIVLVGGCFDILHIGHLIFLDAAKKEGDCLIVLLESDESIKKSKGPRRPLNTQEDRARLLAAFESVDYVVLLPTDMHDKTYDTLVMEIKPAIIATTKGDQYRFHKERQAKSVGASVIDVTDPIKDQSTTKVFEILKEI